MSTHGIDAKHTRFFHAMVLMGGSLALGCGGVTEQTEPDNTPSTGGTAGHDGTGASGSSGGFVGSGGGSGGSGGSLSTGGGISVGTGGLVEPGPFACPPAQWECEAVQCWDYGHMLPDSCPCNTAGPLSPADCQPGEWLVCLDGTENAQGQHFTHSVPFNCQCLPEETSCAPSCDKLGVPGSQCRAASDEDPTILCGCAVVILR
jgi:hypothetical protein